MMIRGTLGSMLAAGLALSAVIASDLQAQRTPRDCEGAATVIARGRPAKADNWALLKVRHCGVMGANAFAAGIAQYATETDVDALTLFMNQVDNWRDASILNAVTRLATNTSATPEARVFAVRHLMLLLRPHLLVSYADLTRSADTTVRADGIVEWTLSGCTPRMISAPHGSLKGAPLPSGYEDRIRAVLEALASSPTTPTPVRNAARCGQTG